MPLFPRARGQLPCARRATSPVSPQSRQLDVSSVTSIARTEYRGARGKSTCSSQGLKGRRTCLCTRESPKVTRRRFSGGGALRRAAASSRGPPRAAASRQSPERRSCRSTRPPARAMAKKKRRTTRQALTVVEVEDDARPLPDPASTSGMFRRQRARPQVRRPLPVTPVLLGARASHQPPACCQHTERPPMPIAHRRRSGSCGSSAWRRAVR